MIPWNKLPQDVQKTILALVLMSGSSAVSGCCSPLVCDPPPPPATAGPSRTPGPIICDPLPPPATTMRPPTSTPLVCDPPPPPASSRTPPPTPTPPPERRFQIRRLQMTSDPTLAGAAVRGSVIDRQGQPLGDIKVSVQSGPTTVQTWTARNGTFLLRIANPGAWQLVVGDDKTAAVPLDLKRYDLAEVEWAEAGPISRAPLPLAEIRLVDIVRSADLTFQADTLWPEARYRWSVTGGTFVEEQDGIAWQPPSEPGRYLLQVVADWGPAGLAVDSVVLVVDENGIVSFA